MIKRKRFKPLFCGIFMVLAKLMHGAVFAGGLATAVLAGNGIYMHSGNTSLTNYDDRLEVALYTAEIAASACAVYGGVFLIYDIERDRKRRKAERIQRTKENLAKNF